jgi:hypothetical protein
MATGLPTFDAFSWASLLAGREALVIDRHFARAKAISAALEEAGAAATLAPGQVVGADRLRDQVFTLVVLGLSDDEPIGERLALHLPGLGPALLILAEPERHPALRAVLPAARIAGHGMSDRDLVMLITGSADE